MVEKTDFSLVFTSVCKNIGFQFYKISGSFIFFGSVFALCVI